MNAVQRLTVDAARSRRRRAPTSCSGSCCSSRATAPEAVEDDRLPHVVAPMMNGLHSTAIFVQERMVAGLTRAGRASERPEHRQREHERAHRACDYAGIARVTLLTRHRVDRPSWRRARGTRIASTGERRSSNRRVDWQVQRQLPGYAIPVDPPDGRAVALLAEIARMYCRCNRRDRRIAIDFARNRRSHGDAPCRVCRAIMTSKCAHVDPIGTNNAALERIPAPEETSERQEIQSSSPITLALAAAGRRAAPMR